MMRKAITIFTAAAMLLAGSAAMAEGGVNISKYKMKDIDGKEVELGKRYKDKVVLVVNVASKCGLTPQYEQLQAMYKKYKEKGFAVAGFPANNFMKQEPGTNLEIKEFCKSKYDVEFDMYSKISVKGDDIHPLYKELTDKEKNGEYGGEIGWNFDKFLVDKKGNVVARFGPRTKPDDKKIVAAIEKELAK